MIPSQSFLTILNESNLHEGTSLFANETELEVGLLPCSSWQRPQHILFQLANTCFCVSYLAPNTRRGILFMHLLLIFGFLMFSTWAWNIICAPDIFSWNFFFMLLNMGHMLYILYTMRQVKFPKELEEIYQSMFLPLKVSRLLYKKLVSLEYAQVLSLHAGEAYAMQNLTRTDRLGLLIAGKVNVMTDHHFLHHIFPKQFLDSPEFESSKAGIEDKFKVSIIASTPCRYIFWQRHSLEYLLIKETHLANVLSVLIARDITSKLYAMNEKIVTEKGSHLDIRLPSITGSITSYGGTHDGQGSRSPASRSMRSKSLHCNSLTHDSLNHLPISPEKMILPHGDREASVQHEHHKVVPMFPGKQYSLQETTDTMNGNEDQLETSPFLNNNVVRSAEEET
ncbi:popeye domain-containing protein 3-like isoform X1 [Tachypleus tridentatus]|uniref:popeye domain-containing protein 3-like isoform X1 n=1 Tax=Tachypleus tridentatus TaxID=6853 RepID=UPI003FD2F528